MTSLFNTIQPTGLTPIIKWAGGKEKELPFIFSNIPSTFSNFYEPFVGGGSVFAALPANQYFINDISSELIELYHCIATSDTSFFSWLQLIMDSWQLMLHFVENHKELCETYVDFREEKLSEEDIKIAIKTFIQSNSEELFAIVSDNLKWYKNIYSKELVNNLTSKIIRMKKIEKERHMMPPSDIFDNIETAFMSSLYTYFRYLYNDSYLMQQDTYLSTALFVFIRNYAYSGMFRYNANGEFNVPYGGIAYNHKLLNKKMAYYKSIGLLQHFKTTKIFNLDFEDFLEKNPPGPDDFVFLDPPYDSTFSTYAQNEFSQCDQRRLAYYLINKCKGKWMMIIKNTPFIYSLYDNDKLNIKSFDKKYTVSFMNRNDKKAEHLIITNYD